MFANLCVLRLGVYLFLIYVKVCFYCVLTRVFFYVLKKPY